MLTMIQAVASPAQKRGVQTIFICWWCHKSYNIHNNVITSIHGITPLLYKKTFQWICANLKRGLNISWESGPTHSPVATPLDPKHHNLRPMCQHTIYEDMMKSSLIFKQCEVIEILATISGVNRNSGAPGQNIEWGPHKSWAMSLIPCWRYRTGYCRVDSLDCQPWKRVVSEFCQLEFEHTFLCAIITYCNVVFDNYKICLELRGPSALGGPLDFVHPCPMVVTPLATISSQVGRLNAFTMLYIKRKILETQIRPHALPRSTSNMMGGHKKFHPNSI